MNKSSWPQSALAVLLAVWTMLGHEAVAQSTAPWPTGTWRFAGTLYLYGPSLDADFSFPKRSGEGNVVVDASNLFDSLNGAFMGAFEANNGRWGVFTDFLYVDISGSKSATRDFSISSVDVPASVTADLDLGIKGSGPLPASTACIRRASRPSMCSRVRGISTSSRSSASA